MLNNPVQMLQAFNQFRQNFRGNPREEVERLVASGRMTQTQLDQLQNMAGQFRAMMQNFNM